MIEGIGFIWLHFPKCAGSATEAALRKLYGDDPRYKFDPIDPANVIWHETIAERMRRDPGFTPGPRMIVCNFRRLPCWMISRVRYEESRPPYRAATRGMILKGRFFENSGYISHADDYVRQYDAHAWIRAEHLSDDFERVFGVRAQIPRINETPPEISDIPLSRDDINALYEACPGWAALEKALYGGLLNAS